MQPQPPVQPVQPPTNYDFTQQQPYQPQPQQPVVPQPDPAIAQMQKDMADIKSALGTLATPQAVTPEPVVEEPKQTYNEWGAVFQDVDKMIDTKLQAQQAQAQQVNSQMQAQEQQNQQYIDTTVGQLRNAGYLPPVENQFDANDPGRQAENELLGYAISLGSTDLVRTAQELKFRHDAGFKYDYQSKQFTQTQQPQQNDPNGNMFGNLPLTPDGQPPMSQFAPQPLQQYQQPVGPQNLYMNRQYPAGFNAPVSLGNSYQGTQGGVPPLKNLRGSSYDALVEQFNRTQ